MLSSSMKRTNSLGKYLDQQNEVEKDNKNRVLIKKEVAKSKSNINNRSNNQKDRFSEKNKEIESKK